MASRRKRMGEILIAAGLLKESQLEAALHSQRTWGGKLGSTLVRMGFAREDDILKCLSSQLRLPSVDFLKTTCSRRAVQAVPRSIAEKYNVMPVAYKEESGKKSVILAMSDPTSLDAISEIEFQTSLRVRPVVATESGINRAIDRYYRQGDFEEREGEGQVVELAPGAAEEMVVYHPDRAQRAAPPRPADEMVILDRGEEKRISPLDGVDPGRLLQVLIRVLEDKGVLDRKDLEEALRGP